MNSTMNHNFSRIVLWSSLLLIFTLLLSACQPAPTPTAAPTEPPVATATAEQVPTEVVVPTPEPTADLAPQLVDALLLLVAMGDAANPAVVQEGTVVTALFASDGTLSGSGGCNNYTTTYTLAGDQLTVATPIASTMMFCETGMEQESAYLAALQSANMVGFSPEGRLEVFYNGTSNKMIFVQGDTPLVDTVWNLVSMGSPSNPTALESGTVVTAIFSEEGSLSGISGCNNYVASYTAQDDQMQVEQVVSTLRACTQGMEQEAAYLQALEAAETFQINGVNLEITYDGGAGVLVFSSRSLPLENILWTLVTVNGVVNTIGLVPTTALFDPGDTPGQGAVGGVAMCNNYNGSYSVDGETLSVSEISQTLVRCPETVAQAETTYLEVLGSAQTYQVFGETLIITSEMGMLTYVANRAPLEGTNWRLTAMGPSTNPQPSVTGADFTAQFTRQQGVPSGLIVGGTGCNDYNAVYAANLTEIKINNPSRTNNTNCAAGLPEQEAQYYQALNEASSYRILGNTLQIFYGDEQVLNYAAFVPQPPPPTTGPLTSLNGTRWWLVSMQNVILVPGTTITADFAINADGTTGTISGTGGCNTYSAPILGFFQVGPASSTKILCSEPAGVMEQEASYLAMLSSANSISQSNNQLVIGTPNGLLVYYNQPVPVLPIEPTPTPTPQAPTPELPTATPEPTLPPATAVPPIATLPPVVPMPPIATVPAVPPQAVISAPQQGAVGEIVIFDASNSSPEGWLGGYTWNFGDGTISQGVLVEHAFIAPGVYTVTLTVVDFYGQTSTTSMNITIQ